MNMHNEYASDVSVILKHLAESLDISPTDYERAVRSYKAVGECLQNGHEKGFYDGCDEEPAVYSQGSINLGTIVRPIRDGKEADFDVDLVCELQALKERSVPAQIKNQVGLCLKDHAIYKDKLEPEGKRCWTLTYAESAGIGFHMDVLPCVPCPEDDHSDYPGAVSLTNKNKDRKTYDWSAGSPKGYGAWFRDKNSTFEDFATRQKEMLFEFCQKHEGVLMKCASIEDIPDQLVRTPLQRAIQLMKRHRDIHFSKNPKYKPISIIITTLAAHLYRGEQDVYAALSGIVKRMVMHQDFLQNRYASIDESVAPLKLITRDEEGKWVIANPVNEGENFAERWHEDGNARAKAFFEWAHKLAQDIENIPVGKGLGSVASYLEPLFGERVAKEAMGRMGDSFRSQREKGALRMASGTGQIGTIGSVAVKDHKFYGE